MQYIGVSRFDFRAFIKRNDSKGTSDHSHIGIRNVTSREATCQVFRYHVGTGRIWESDIKDG